MTPVIGAQTAGIKVAFRFDKMHPLSLNEFFGWDGDYSAMMDEFNDYKHPVDGKQHLAYISEFTQIDGDTGGATDDLVVFMIDAPVDQFQAEYEKCVTFLNALATNPPFNDNETIIDNMKQDLVINMTKFDDNITTGTLYQLYNREICPFQYMVNYLNEVNKHLTPLYQAA